MTPNRTLSVILIFFMNTCLHASTEVPEESNLMCGPNCLWLVAKSYNINTTLAKLRYFAKTNPYRGTNVDGMLRALKEIGLEPLLIRTDWAGLKKILHPAILFVGQPSGGHYVFLEKIQPNFIRIIDAPRRKTWTQKQFMSRFTGYAIVACGNPDEAQKFKHQLASGAPRISKGLYLFIAGASLVVTVFWAFRRCMRRKNTTYS